MNKKLLVLIAISTLFIFDTFYADSKLNSQDSSLILEKIIEAINNVLERSFDAKDNHYFNSIERLRSKIIRENSSLMISAKRQSIPGYPWGQLLFSLVKSLQPKTALELGSCIGVSGSYFAAGLESNGFGRLYTAESFEPFEKEIRSNFDALGYARYSILMGEMQKTIQEIVPLLAPIDLVFDDHLHETEPVLKNFDGIYSYLANKAVYIFDDIQINEGMIEAWKRLQEDPRINITISMALGYAYPHRPNLGSMPRIGIGIVLKNSSIKEHYDIKIDELDNKRQVIFQNKRIVIN